MSSELDELYAVPVEQFMAKREELAKALKAAGNKDAAAEVKKAGKPTLAAHALNLLARQAKAELEELFDAARVLASGKDFKASLERQRAALEAVRKKVSGDDGPAVLQVVQGAAAVPELAAAVLQGRFAKLPEVPVGFFGAAPEGAPPVVVAPSIPPPPKKSPPKPLPLPSPPKVDHARERKLKAAHARAEKAAKEVEALEEKLAAAKRRAEEAAEHVAELEKELPLPS